jgi:hypothetical protein
MKKFLLLACATAACAFASARASFVTDNEAASATCTLAPDWCVVGNSSRFLNGRIYDPQTGRFLSADVEIQFPNDLQSYNRYSYCLNNPLGYRDPTGYQAEDRMPGETAETIQGELQATSWRRVDEATDRMNAARARGDTTEAWRIYSEEVVPARIEANEQAGRTDISQTTGIQNGPCCSGPTELRPTPETQELVEQNKIDMGGDGSAVAKVNTQAGVPRVASSTLRRMWERVTGKSWPKDNATGKNQDVSHKQAVADQGSNSVNNIEPLPHGEHMSMHKNKGDFRRWGARAHNNQQQTQPIQTNGSKENQSGNIDDKKENK